jgi:protein-S-isoprenylcysteine O-methyltransferase Ste14
MNKSAGARRFAWFVYAVIGFEILYMISPFAFFYYSAYGLPLNYLLKNEATSWLTMFILPHYSYSGNLLIRLHGTVGWILILAGLALFAVGFYQIYSAKIFKKREVTGGLYRWIRHPQYLSLAILGAGTFLVWPRFIILIAFVTMLFLYYFLARAEELECLARFGTVYAEYQTGTGMFFPRMTRKKGFTLSPGSFLPEKGASRLAAILSLYVLLVLVTVFSGHALRNYSLSTLAFYSDSTASVLSLVKMDAGEIKKIYETVSSNKKVRTKLPSPGKYIIYLLPEAWHIPELPVSFAPEHVMPDRYDENAFKILVASATGPAAGATGIDILGKATGFEPHALVFIDRRNNAVKSVVAPPGARWAGIAVPLF